MHIDLKGKTAVVTASTAGIGAAIAEQRAAARASSSTAAAMRRCSPRSAPARRPPRCGLRRRRGRPVRCRRRCARHAAHERGRHPRQQRGHLRPEGVLRHRRRRMGTLLPDERDVRRAPRAALPEGDDRTQRRAHRVHFVGIRPEHPGRHDSLRFHENRAAVDRTRPREARGRHERDGQLGAAGADDVGRRAGAAEGNGRRNRPQRRGRGRGFRAQPPLEPIIQRPATPEEVANPLFTCARRSRRQRRAPRCGWTAAWSTRSPRRRARPPR